MTPTSHSRTVDYRVEGRAVILLVAAFAFAYRAIATYHPSEGARGTVEGFEGFFFSPAGSSPVLLLILAAYLVYARRFRLFASMRAEPTVVELLASLVLLVAASGLALWAHYVDAIGLQIPSMSLLLIGGGLFLGGLRGAASMLLPSLFLVLAYPHPAIALNAVIWPMQLFTAKSTVAILELFGGDPILSGDLIFADNGRVFQVIESCAGLRSIETLIMSSLIYAEIFHRRGPRRVILVLASPLIGLMANQARVLSIVLNPFSNVEFVHSAQGITMLVIGVLTLAGLDGLLGRLPSRWMEPRKPAPPLRVDDVRGGLASGQPRMIALAVLLAVLGVSTRILPPWTAGRERMPSITSISPRLGEWSAESIKPDEEFYGSVGFHQWNHLKYKKGPMEARMMAAVNNRLEPRMSLISDKTAVPGPGFTLVEHERDSLDPAMPQVDRLVWRKGPHAVVTYHWYLGVASFSEELLRSTFALDRGPFRRPGRSLFVRVSMPMPRDRTHWDEAEAELVDLATRLQAELDEIESTIR